MYSIVFLNMQFLFVPGIYKLNYSLFTRTEFLFVPSNYVLDSRAQEFVPPIVVELDHALQENGTSSTGFRSEFANTRKNCLDVGGRRLLACDLCDIKMVVKRQQGLVGCPEVAIVKA